MLDRDVSAAFGRRLDRADAWVVDHVVDRDDGDGPVGDRAELILATANWEHDQSVAAPVDEGLDDLFLFGGVALGAGEIDEVAVAFARLLDAAGELGEERVGQVGGHQAEGEALTSHESTRHEVRPVAEMVDDFEHSGARRGGRARTVVDDAGHRANRDPGLGGDVVQRGRTPRGTTRARVGSGRVGRAHGAESAL